MARPKPVKLSDKIRMEMSNMEKEMKLLNKEKEQMRNLIQKLKSKVQSSSTNMDNENIQKNIEALNAAIAHHGAVGDFLIEDIADVSELIKFIEKFEKVKNKEKQIKTMLVSLELVMESFIQRIETENKSLSTLKSQLDDMTDGTAKTSLKNSIAKQETERLKSRIELNNIAQKIVIINTKGDKRESVLRLLKNYTAQLRKLLIEHIEIQDSKKADETKMDRNQVKALTVHGYELLDNENPSSEGRVIKDTRRRVHAPRARSTSSTVMNIIRTQRKVVQDEVGSLLDNLQEGKEVNLNMIMRNIWFITEYSKEALIANVNVNTVINKDTKFRKILKQITLPFDDRLKNNENALASIIENAHWQRNYLNTLLSDKSEKSTPERHYVIESIALMLENWLIENAITFIKGNYENSEKMDTYFHAIHEGFKNTDDPKESFERTCIKIFSGINKDKDKSKSILDMIKDSRDLRHNAELKAAIDKAETGSIESHLNV